MELRNNSIKKEIEEILEIRDELLEEEFVFYAPQSDVEIRTWEEKNKITIPEDYKEWLRFSDGAKLEGDFARFFGLNQFIINRTDYEKPIVIIGSLVGDGEILAFSIETGEILKILDGRTTIFDDFKEYLEFLINIL